MATRKNYFNPLKGQPVKDVPPELISRLPRGLALPPTIISNRWQTLSGLSKVEQDMFVTLQTPPGSHLGQPDFGSMVPYMLFEGGDDVDRPFLRSTIKLALATWMGGVITVNEVLLSEQNLDAGYIDCAISYSVPGSDSRLIFNVPLATSDTTQLPPGSYFISGIVTGTPL